MRHLLTILLFISLQSHSQALFFQHNQVSAPLVPTYTPPSVTSGLVADWWADFGVTHDGGGIVSAWADQSGSGHDLAQSTIGRQPTFTPSALGGHATLAFGGTEFLSAANFLSGATEATVVWVARLNAYPPALQGETGMPLNYNVATAGNNNHYPWTDGNVYHGNGTNARKSYTPTTSLSAWHVFTHVAGANDWRDYLGSVVQYSTASNTFQANNTDITVGGLSASYFMKGQIGRILVYNRKLTDTERASLLSELTTYYGL